jgi:hypothetical protein
MINNIDQIDVNQTAYNLANKVKAGEGSGTEFANVLSDAMKEQAMQSVMAGMGGLGATDSIMGGYFPQMMAGIESAIVTASEPGDLSGVQLMLFMMLMMMQTNDGGGDLMPILQMVTQMVAPPQQSGNETAGSQNDMMKTWNTEPDVRRMVDIALSQVGTRERNSDGSYGSGNFTEYGAWYGLDGQPWCAMFVSWAADRAGVLNDVVPRHASTARGVSAYQEKGLYAPRGSGYIPREGDAIYFHNPATGRVNHVGIVVAFDHTNQRVYTVEGNTDNAVRIRHYEFNNPRIHGYGRNGGTGFGTIPAISSAGSGANTM